MGLGALLGRILLATIFILNGIHKIQNPGQSASYLSDNYRKFYDWMMFDVKLSDLVGPHVPDQVMPKSISAHSTQIILYTGYFEVGVGVLMILGSGFAGFLAGNFIFLTTAIFHNPFLGKDKAEYLQNTYQLILNLAIAGGCFLVGDSHLFGRKSAGARTGDASG